ncbi:unnamed protein product [Orchesella dallaii]
MMHGTGYREHEERGKFRFTDDIEPDPTVAIDVVKCNEVNNLAYDESVTFKLKKRKKECIMGFIGSRAEQCTATIVCTPIKFAEPERGGVCYKGSIKVTDGIGGQITMCGKTPFGGPYIPSKNGTDLYVSYSNPTSKDTVCMVVCNEDRLRQKEFPAKPLPNAAIPRRDRECLCGVKPKSSTPGGRVVGGKTADPFEFPWLTAIVDSNTRLAFCGGSLINDRYVLTAAHCFAGSSPVRTFEAEVLLHAHLLDLNLNSNYNPRAPAGKPGSVKAVPGLKFSNKTDDDELSIRIGISKIIVHPLYSSRSTDFDVALLRLEHRVDLHNPEITTICLPTEGNVRGYANQTTIIAGWGKPHEAAGAGSRLLQKLSLPVIHYKQCNKLLQSPITSRMMCAGYLKGGKDACVGDSGGPLIYQFNQKQFRQIGIVSFGHGCARVNTPGVFVNVQEVLPWIFHQTMDAMWCLKQEPDEASLKKGGPKAVKKKTG